MILKIVLLIAFLKLLGWIMITCIEYLVFFFKKIKNCNFETFTPRHEELIGAEFLIYKQLGKNMNNWGKWKHAILRH